jgi:hypothetical protein
MPPIVPPLSDYSPTELPQALLLQDAPLLLENEYLPLEAGYAVAPDGMHHVAASTYMRGCSGKMIDWWFGYVHHTQEYKLWHPRDHVFSDWRGPRENKSSYIGGSFASKLDQFPPATPTPTNIRFNRRPPPYP